MDVESIKITPAVVLYTKFMQTSMWHVYNELLEALDNHESKDLREKIQAWEIIRAAVKCFRDCDKWDEELQAPIFVTQEAPNE